MFKPIGSVWEIPVAPGEYDAVFRVLDEKAPADKFVPEYANVPLPN